MRTQNCPDIRKSTAALEGVPQMMFNVPSIPEFPKKGANVSERDIEIAKQTVGITQYPTYFDKDIHELAIGYTKINKLIIPCVPGEGLRFYIYILQGFEKDNLLVRKENKFDFKQI